MSALMLTLMEGEDDDIEEYLEDRGISINEFKAAILPVLPLEYPEVDKIGFGIMLGMQIADNLRKIEEALGEV